jgi:hypothetical protein
VLGVLLSRVGLGPTERANRSLDVARSELSRALQLLESLEWPAAARWSERHEERRGERGAEFLESINRARALLEKALSASTLADADPTHHAALAAALAEFRRRLIGTDLDVVLRLQGASLGSFRAFPQSLASIVRMIASATGLPAPAITTAARGAHHGNMPWCDPPPSGKTDDEIDAEIAARQYQIVRTRLSLTVAHL